MKAIILAAGRGSRMGSATRDQPKCFTEIAGKSLISWQMEALMAAGADEVGLVVGYQSQQLERLGATTFHNPQWASTNMVMSLVAAANWLKAGPCLVSYSDIVYGPQAPAALMKASMPLTITYDRLWEPLWRLRFQDPLSDAETFALNERGELLEIGNRARSLTEIQGQYMGLLAFTPSGWSSVDNLLQGMNDGDRNKLDMTGLLNRLLATGVPIGTCPLDGGWCEVDSLDDLRAYEAELMKPGKWSHDWR